MDQPQLIANRTPWYREPWPWILMSGPAVAVVASFVSLYFAVSGADPLVADNYYKEGLAINRVIDRDHAASTLGYHAAVMIGSGGTLVRVQLTGGGAKPQALRLRFVHPTKAGLDRSVMARQIQPGWYEAEIELAPANHWYVQLEDLEQSWRLTGEWLPGDASFVLAPRRG
jgi:uncharacterized protein